MFMVSAQKHPWFSKFVYGLNAMKTPYLLENNFLQITYTATAKHGNIPVKISLLSFPQPKNGASAAFFPIPMATGDCF